MLLNDQTSNGKPVLAGAPKGPVLDPFRFIIYKNDFGKCIEHSKTYDLDDD